MPSQDSHQRHPDSENITTIDRVVRGRKPKDNRPIGSAKKACSSRTRDFVRLDVAVDNDAVCTSLKDIVGAHAAETPSSTNPDDVNTDVHAAVARVFQAQEEIARRIAQSLHDEASQMLALVYLELANIARKSPAPTAERIDRVIGLLDTMCEHIRGLSHELHPMVLERHGLHSALKQLASGAKKRSGLEVRLDCRVAEMPAAVEAGLYRVIQEALSNVIRHAEAGRVDIRLWQTDNRIHCSVRDDGIGYQPADKGSKGACGLGLVGIYERVDSLGGDCHIFSGNRKGMELQLGIPL